MLAAPLAHACRCAQTGSIEQAYIAATAVIVAEAIKIKTSAKAKSNLAEQHITWRVWEAFKGTHAKDSQLITNTVTSCCMCGLSIEQGEVMLLYVNGSQPYHLSSCSKSLALKAAVADIPALYKLKKRHQR
jgi:hypothetical protein